MRAFDLGANQPQRFYAGGAAIARLRAGGDAGAAPADATGSDMAPEDWVASTTTLFGEEREGLSTLPDGRLLRAVIAENPDEFLGPDHVRDFGADLGLLVKLLDAGQRLPVHVHPDREFARRHLDCRYGKTEAWYVIDVTEPDPAVYVGPRRDLAADELAEWVAAQDGDAMLDALHAVRVRPGDTVLVPAGTPHAIGSGVFVCELQEPTDWSVLLEWRAFPGTEEADAALRLGWETALQSVRRTAMDEVRLRRLRAQRPGSPGVTQLFPDDADPYFRAERIGVATRHRLSQDVSVLIVLDGTGELLCDDEEPLPLQTGSTVLVPWGAGTTVVAGHLELVRCRPPRQAPPPP